MISGHQGFLTSGDQDAKTSIRIDFLISLFHDGLSSRFIRPVSVQFCSRCRLRERAVRLFVLADEQGETGRDVRPVFESPEHKKCSGLSKLCFPLREIFSVTKTACPQGGGKLLRSRRFLPGPRWPDSKFKPLKVFRTPLVKTTHTIEGKIAISKREKDRPSQLEQLFSAIETAKFRTIFVKLVYIEASIHQIEGR